MSTAVHVVKHPLIQEKLTLCRRKDTPPQEFRPLVEEITHYLLYEAAKDWPLKETEIETPLGMARGYLVSRGKPPVFVAVLRAGLGMLSSALRMVPGASSGHIGLYRNEDTLQPVQYYCNLPGGLEDREVILLDPMLATGGSAVAALELLKEKGARDLKFIALVAAPEGIARVQENFPQVKIYVAAVDEGLNDIGYIVPGLGDAGDRLFDTL
jgi:uracil phosphoribosyltransferase